MSWLTEEDIRQFDILSVYATKGNREVYSYGDVNVMREQHSISKILTSTAIGLLFDDEKLKIEDKISDYLNLPSDSDPQIFEVKIKDLLTLTMGTHKGFLFHEERAKVKEDFVNYIARQPIERKVSKYFEYSDAPFYLLSRIVEKISGKPMDIFLNERLFDKMNIKSEQGERCIDNHTLGCSGYLLSTADMAKVGQFYLDNGKFGDIQLLSNKYISLATVKHVRVNSRDKYGFGWWVRNDFYYCSGAKNQLLVVVPSEKFVLAINSNNEIGHVREFLEKMFYFMTK